MTSERWQAIKPLVADALERPPAERAAFLDDACRGDLAMRAEIESLISYGDRDDVPPLDVPDEASESGRSAEPFALPVSAASGLRIGPYRTIRELGRGGMGAVHLAARADDEFRQQVAIKLLHRGMDGDLVVRRFRNERQILAALDHPNVARLLDGGTSEDGAPYLVMEYVDGLPVDGYCDRHLLDTEQRLRLFLQIGAAVQYAHQRLVIHRDIKPSNVLVTAAGTPKLLDFGIAKLLTSELAAQTLDPTVAALRLLTPAYASPEHITGGPITTSADVYSLAVLLYELLTGHRPYRTKNRGPQEIMRAVLEDEPTRPSAVVMLNEELTGDAGSAVLHTPAPVSRARERTPERLRRRLRGDLDVILLTALRKDPARRYGSVEQLLDDIRRHLDGLPVAAREDTFGYRTAKFVRRNRIGVATATVAIGLLLAGVVAIDRQRTRAERRFNDVRSLAHAVVFDYHDAIADLPGSTPVRQRIIRDALTYLDSLAAEARGDRTLQRELATAYSKIGDVQGNSNIANLGDTSGALESYRKSLAIRASLRARETGSRELTSDLAESHERIGDVLRTKGDLKGADASYANATALLQTQTDDPSQRRRLGDLLYRVGNLKGYPRTSNLGDTAGAIRAHLEALTIRETLSAADPTNVDRSLDVLESQRMLVNIMSGVLGDSRSAEPHGRAALAIGQRLAAAHPGNVRVLRALLVSEDAMARLLMRKGSLDEALEVSRRSLETAESVRTADPKNMQARQDVASGHTLAGNILLRRKEAGPAAQEYRRALEMDQAMTADDPDNRSSPRWVASDYMALGVALRQAGDFKGALRSHQEAVSRYEALYRRNPDVQMAEFVALGYARLGDTLAEMGNPTAALKQYRQSVALADEAATRPSSNDDIRRTLREVPAKIVRLRAAQR